MFPSVILQLSAESRSCRASVADHPTQQLETPTMADVSIMIGDEAQAASFLTIGQDNFTAFVSEPPLNALPADKLHTLYPVPGKFSTDAEAIIALNTDMHYRWYERSMFQCIGSLIDPQIALMPSLPTYFPTST